MWVPSWLIYLAYIIIAQLTANVPRKRTQDLVMQSYETQLISDDVTVLVRIIWTEAHEIPSKKLWLVSKAYISLSLTYIFII